MKKLCLFFLVFTIIGGCGSLPKELALKDYSHKADKNGWHYFRNGKFKGSTKNGLPSGKGKYVYKNGVEYTGDFKDGNIDGSGSMIIPTVGKLDGKFSKGMFVEGEIFYENGDYYNGYMAKGKKQGIGYFFTKKYSYYGEFNNDYLHGEGSITYLETNLNQSGTFQNGKLHGDVIEYNLTSKEAKYDYFENGTSQLTKKLTTEAKVIVDKQQSLEIASINKKVNEANTEINQLEEKLTKMLSGETNFDEAIGPNEVKIGSQIWMNKNLDTDTFQNGDLIPHHKTYADWCSSKEESAWCYYNNDKSLGIKVGKLYNGYAVMDKRGLCPTGWHVPSLDEWRVLIGFLNYNYDALKSSELWKRQYWMDDSNWHNELKYFDNSSGFTGLPGGSVGYCANDGTYFQLFSQYGRWWSSTPNSKLKSSDGEVWHIHSLQLLNYSSEGPDVLTGDRRYSHSNGIESETIDDGLSVRCLKNTAEAKTAVDNYKQKVEEERRKEEAIRKIKQEKSIKTLQFSTLKLEQEKIVTSQNQSYDSRVTKKVQEKKLELYEEARKKVVKMKTWCDENPNHCKCKVLQNPKPGSVRCA
jgi:uncharacterized protein (TIGR02145 family)